MRSRIIAGRAKDSPVDQTAGPGWVRRVVAEHPVRQIGPVFLAGRRVPGWAVRRAPSEGAVYLRADYVARVAERGDPARVIPMLVVSGVRLPAVCVGPAGGVRVLRTRWAHPKLMPRS